jgi:hypothetical protein
MALETMQKAHLDAAERDVHGKISKQTVQLDTVKVTRVRFDVGGSGRKTLRSMQAPRAACCPT